jgi:cell wall-associated NlpC family hydrolase
VKLRAGIWATVAAAGLLLVASCSGGPRHQTKPGEPGPYGPARQDVVRFAKTFVGTPYRSGGTTHKGVDCSGLAYVVYREFDIRLPRTSLDQSRAGAPVERSDIKPADLLFFKTWSRGPVSHVGIYIGNGRFIHASTGARAVRIDVLSDQYYKSRYAGARRLLES